MPQELLQHLRAALAADPGALKYLESLNGAGVAAALLQVGASAGSAKE